ncbi:protease modulator HflC [Persicobacter diffluens]|uniref:Protein HflC n=1 Tax=Persicobacter diffluens TaxID=981 RepID=A0AAN4W0J8_9BACT|nr:protein HflC [Persicobacter diffluens]
MNIKIIILSVIFIFVGLFISQSLFIVDETEQVVITQFGRPVRSAITSPGINFKVPFIQTTHFFDKRFLEWDGDPNQVPTKDKKYIFVDTYARWQISDPLQFFKRLKNERNAQSRLDDILDGETRDFIANHELEEAVRSTNRTPIVADTLIDTKEELHKISTGREKIQEMIQESANEQAKDLGIEILDFRFKRINYISEVRKQVYERMKSERFRIADKFKSEGFGEASRINGEKEKELKKIQSEAFRMAEEIKGKADAKAAAIYTQAYNQSKSSRELYQFMKSMETFQETFDQETSVILSTESELYQYLNRY